MPRYLGINYWQNVVDQRREFYSRALLPVPHHLKQVNSATNSNEDQRIEIESQLQACRDVGSFTDISISTRESLEFLRHFSVDIDDVYGRPEKYDRDTEFHNINSEMVEVVPSSNPESVYSFLSDELFDSCELFDDTCEMFEKEDMRKYSNEQEKDMLEDVATLDGMKEIRTHIPQLPLLLSRLKPKLVKDPLADDDGMTYTEDMWFTNHLKMDVEENVNITSYVDPQNHFEVFDKTSLSVNVGELEEILSPPRKQVKEDSVLKMLDIATDIKTFIQNETVEHVDKQGAVKLVSCTFPANGIEKPELTTSSPVQRVDFIKINDLEQDDDEFVKEALLESPIVSPDTVCMTQTHGLDLPHMLQELQPVSPEHCNTIHIFLRQFEKENLVARVWQEEKFFDEIIALRLPEPDAREDLSHHATTVGDLMKQLQLKEESGLGTVELQLGWDPCVYSRTVMSKATHVEQISLDGMELEVAREEVETYVKYSQDQFVNEYPSILQDEMEKKSEFQKTIYFKDDFKNVNFISEENTKSTRKEPKQVVTATDESFADFSPLDQFMMLRTSEDLQQKFDKVSSKPSEIVITKTVEQKTVTKQFDVVACNSILDVEFTGQYEQVLVALYRFGSPYVDVLKQAGEIPKHASLSSLSLDSTRFLVKQKEKQMEDKTKQESGYDIYKSLLVVYAVVGATDLLIHCCLESAISHLSAVHEKYQNTLKGCLDDIRKELFQYKVWFDQGKIVHPKVATLCRNAEDFLKGTSGDFDKKVLIVVKRSLASLLSYLEKSLSLSGETSTFIVKTLDEETYSQMETHNCIIINKTAIDKSFKWSFFHLVMEFEESTDSISKWCQAENINFLSLRSRFSHEKKMDQSDHIFSKLSKTPEVKVTVIGSQHLTRQKNLLQLLESRHNIGVIERNYEEISDRCPFADIILDERHGIVLHCLSDISEEWQVEHLSWKLAALGLQYTQCWLIFYSMASKSGGYLLPNPLVTNICKLEAALANLNSNSDKFHIFYKVLIAYSMEQLAELVRSCCDTCIETSTIWKIDEWNRDWITGDATQDEQFLLSLPCLNSFSAHLLLLKTCLGSLLSYTLPQLIRVAPQLPEKVLLTFYKVVNCDTGLHLRSQEKKEREFQKQDFSNDGRSVTVDDKQQQFSKKNNCPHQPYPSQINDYEDFDKVQALQMYDVNHLKVPQDAKPGMPTTSRTFYPRSFREDGQFPSLKQYETKVSLSHDTDNAFLDVSQEYKCQKPNQYVLAKIEGKAEKEGWLEGESVVPNFDLVDSCDILHSSHNDEDNTCSSLVKFDLDDSNDFSELSWHQSKPLLKKEDSDLDIPFPNVCMSNIPGPDKDRKKLNKKPSYSATLHDKLMTRNRIMEEFKTNDSYQNINHVEHLPEYHLSSGHMFQKENRSQFFPERSQSQHYDNRSKVNPMLSGNLHSDRCQPVTSVLGNFSTNHSTSSSWSSLPRSTSRKPALSEHFRSRLLMPPIQRVSIGLAQPLRRNMPTELLEQKGPKEYRPDPDNRWLTEGSPPMDLEPDSPLQQLPYYQTLRENRNYLYNNLDGACGRFPESQTQGGQLNNFFAHEDFPNKRKKLTYKPLPGRSAGQTVLAFR